MDIPGPTTDYQSALSAFSTPVFSDNVRDLLGVGTLPKNPTAIITVNSTADVVDDSDGVTTLREAINQANADNGEDLIVFERSLFSTAQTITLTGGELDITHNLSIIAPRDSLTGEDLLTVSGNQTSRVFEIEKGATVSIDGLIIADGKVQNNSGGGIKNSGIMNVSNSTIIGNSVFLTPISGQVNYDLNAGLYLLIKGGGIYNSGTMNVSSSTIRGNEASFGGGIYNTDTMNVSSSTISGNKAGSGGGIYSGGIFSSGGIIEVNNSTISGNSASAGGGINGGRIIKVNNSTISGNSASLYGGGIFNGYSSTLTLLFSTVTQNQAANGGGVYQENNVLSPLSNVVRGSNKVRNTIIAANRPTKFGINPDVSGTFSSDGYNLIGSSTGSTGFDATGDIVGTTDNPIDPRLAPLDFYGGDTQTIALRPDSPAIDAGDPTNDTDPTTDQRGFPRVVNGRADIGAFEFSV